MNINQFSERDHAELYNMYRPDIPEEIARRIVSYLKEKFNGFLEQAVDIGCGNGQSTVALASFFRHVTGIDNSKTQIEEAKNSRTWPNITLTVGPAEILPFETSSVQLVTACASLHWFEEKTFFAEVRRILPPNGVFVAYTYHYVKPLLKDPVCSAEIDRFFAEKNEELRPYYTKNVISSLKKYDDINFPFEEVLRPSDVRQIFTGNLADVIGYIKSLSGYRNMKREDPPSAEMFITSFYEKLKEILKLGKETENQILTLYRDFYLIFCRKSQ